MDFVGVFFKLLILVVHHKRGLCEVRIGKLFRDITPVFNNTHRFKVQTRTRK